MTYLQDRNKKNKHTVLLAAGSVVMLFVLLEILGLFSYKKILPINLGSQLSTNTTLKNKISELETEYANYKFLSNNPNITQSTSSLVRLNRETPISIYGTVLFSRSEVNDIEKIILDKDLNAIGLISEEYDNNIKAILFWANKDITKGYIPNKNIELSFEGDSKGVLKAKYPNNIDVQIGDNVYLSDIPKVRLGYIVSVTENEKEPFKVAYIRNGGNINSQTTFFVLKK